MPEFSIIIPVFNAEKTILRCLESIAAQTFRSFEVLLIDDGSTDSSAKLCGDFAARDHRFRYYFQVNGGPSAARNYGIELARGKYLTFIDSDDYVSGDYLESIQKGFSTGAEAVFFGYKALYEGKETLEYLPPPLPNDHFECLTVLSDSDMFGYTCIKAFLRERIGNKRFRTNMRLLEDEVFTCEVLSVCAKIAVLPKALYYYVIGHENALTKRTHQNYCQLQDEVFCAWNKMLADYEKREAYLRIRADTLVSKCRFYLFEHKLAISSFCRSLEQTNFFRFAQTSGWFSQCVIDHKYFIIFLRRFYYRRRLHGYSYYTRLLRKLKMSKLLK